MLIKQSDVAVIIDARTAAWLERYTNVAVMRVQVRGTNPAISAALLELRYAAASWRDTATGTPIAVKPEPATNSEQWLSTGQAADLLGVTGRAIRKAIAEARLPAQKVGGMYRISREDIEHFRAARTERPSA